MASSSKMCFTNSIIDLLVTFKSPKLYVNFVACNTGVSCDTCMKGNFTGKRYKCLICYDYDLCASCYEAGTASSRHSPDHPMQCILTRADFGTCSFFIMCPVLARAVTIRPSPFLGRIRFIFVLCITV